LRGLQGLTETRACRGLLGPLGDLGEMAQLGCQETEAFREIRERLGTLASQDLLASPVSPVHWVPMVRTAPQVAPDLWVSQGQPDPSVNRGCQVLRAPRGPLDRPVVQGPLVQLVPQDLQAQQAFLVRLAPLGLQGLPGTQDLKDLLGQRANQAL